MSYLKSNFMNHDHYAKLKIILHFKRFNPPPKKKKPKQDNNVKIQLF